MEKIEKTKNKNEAEIFPKGENASVFTAFVYPRESLFGIGVSMLSLLLAAAMREIMSPSMSLRKSGKMKDRSVRLRQRRILICPNKIEKWTFETITGKLK